MAKGDVITSSKRVEWVSTIVMSAMFGNLGVDRFMMGHIWLGILKLITLGGLGVWWLVDLILIARRYQFKGVQWYLPKI